MEVLEPVGHLFYIVSFNRTTFRKLREVPDYIGEAVPNLVVLFLLEICISFCLRKRSNLRVNDTISCLSQGVIFELSRLFVPGGQIALYAYIYINWRVIDLPWNAHYTWWICFLVIDFAYYWIHRSAHEINILWATHQVHHSSEDFNISTQVRQSVLQNYINWILYLPVALVMPPTAFLVHIQFSYLYQFWIHSDVIKSLGPLEYVLNTMSHHRVHHGANKSCIDKNYGGTLIIWDRLFGTFEAENEEIVYGITQPVNTFEPLHIQFNHLSNMLKSFREYKGWKNKLFVILKGPGWSPGKPRLGDPKDLPDIKAPAQKYNPELPWQYKLYVILHFFLLVQGYTNIMKYSREMPATALYMSSLYILISLVSIGICLNRSWYCSLTELVRCILYFVIDHYLSNFFQFSLTQLQAKWNSEMFVKTALGTSLVFWAIYCPLHVSITSITRKRKNVQKSGDFML